MALATYSGGPKDGQTTRVFAPIGWQYREVSGGRSRVYRLERQGVRLILRLLK